MFATKVQSNLIKGLDNFIIYYDKSTEIRFHNSKEYWKVIVLIGVVFHFIKKSDTGEDDKCWSKYNGLNGEFLYFKKLQTKYMTEIETLLQVIHDYPILSYYIVGIDAASVENNTKPWVLAPVFRKARSSTAHKIISAEGIQLRNLGFTFHAGEDFRHILTGLRRIDLKLTTKLIIRGECIMNDIESVFIELLTCGIHEEKAIDIKQENISLLIFI